jgi:hypothetical protein
MRSLKNRKRKERENNKKRDEKEERRKEKVGGTASYNQEFRGGAGKEFTGTPS